MPAAVSTITQSGQISLPKQFRDILGVKPHDQVAFLSDGKRVEIVAVPEDPLTLGSREEFLDRVARAEDDYEQGNIVDARKLADDLVKKYGL